jgi:hypothetical protein
MDENPYQSPKPVGTDAGRTAASRFGASHSRPGRPQLWRGILGGIFLLLPGIKLVSAQKGLLGLLGVLPLDSEYPDWSEYVFHTVVFGTGFLAGLYQWRIWRRQHRAYATWLRSRTS